MSDLEQSALAVYFANCQGIKSDPLPMLRKVLALGEGDRRRLDWLDQWRSDDVARGSDGEPELVGHYWAVQGQCATVREAIDAAMTPTRPASS